MRITTANTQVLDPITAVDTTDLSRESDGAMATANRLELIALLADRAAPKGYVTTCTIAYQVPGQEFAQQHTLETDYAGIWAWLYNELGTELNDYGITSLGQLLSPGSPIKMAFGRLMPGEDSTMPDRVVTDGNSSPLIWDVIVAFSVTSVPKKGDPNDLNDVELSHTM